MVEVGCEASAHLFPWSLATSSTAPPFQTPTHVYVLPKSMPMVAMLRTALEGSGGVKHAFTSPRASKVPLCRQSPVLLTTKVSHTVEAKAAQQIQTRGAEIHGMLYKNAMVHSTT